MMNSNRYQTAPATTQPAMREMLAGYPLLDVSGNPTNQVTHYGALTTAGAREYDTLGQEIFSTDALGHATTPHHPTAHHLPPTTYGSIYPPP